MRILHQDFLHHDSQAIKTATHVAPSAPSRTHTRTPERSSISITPQRSSDLSLAPFDDGDDVTVKAGGSAGVSHGGASSTRANPSPFCSARVPFRTPPICPSSSCRLHV